MDGDALWPVRRGPVQRLLTVAVRGSWVSGDYTASESWGHSVHGCGERGGMKLRGRWGHWRTLAATVK